MMFQAEICSHFHKTITTPEYPSHKATSYIFYWVYKNSRMKVEVRREPWKFTQQFCKSSSNRNACRPCRASHTTQHYGFTGHETQAYVPGFHEGGCPAVEDTARNNELKLSGNSFYKPFSRQSPSKTSLNCILIFDPQEKWKIPWRLSKLSCHKISKRKTQRYPFMFKLGHLQCVQEFLGQLQDLMNCVFGLGYQ